MIDKLPPLMYEGWEIEHKPSQSEPWVALPPDWEQILDDDLSDAMLSAETREELEELIRDRNAQPKKPIEQMVDATTFTSKCRRMLDNQPDQAEFTLSRVGLEILVTGSERYAETSKTNNALLLTARAIASNTTTLDQNARAWTSGQWDENLPQLLKDVADHHKKTIDVLNRERNGDLVKKD